MEGVGGRELERGFGMSAELGEIIRPAIPLARAFATRRQDLTTSEKSDGQFVSEADELSRSGSVAVLFP